MKPLAIDLFCGLGGWAEGFLAEGYDVVGFDIERHDYGTGAYPGQLVIQDVSTLDGHQFRNAAVIVASPPCQEYSYMAMPWSRGKARAAAIREDISLWLKLTCLFNCCFRIAHEAGIPVIVENVRGAEPWVGPARWHFGSFYLWGDVPALMPTSGLRGAMKLGVAHRGDDVTNFHGVKAGDRNKGRANGGHKWDTEFKVPGFRFDGSGRSFQTESVKAMQDGLGGYGGNFGWNNTPLRRGNSKSAGRKAASAQIAKIPFPLAQHIARVFKPGPFPPTP